MPLVDRGIADFLHGHILDQVAPDFQVRAVAYDVAKPLGKTRSKSTMFFGEDLSFLAAEMVMNEVHEGIIAFPPGLTHDIHNLIPREHGDCPPFGNICPAIRNPPDVL